MKTKLQCLFAYIGLAFCAGNLVATPFGTAFTYQGRLADGGNPPSGSYDFRFRLASDAQGNNYVGSTILTNGLAVSGGLFTVPLDFGAGVFTGSNYWLEVGVKTNGGSSYTVLSPLQALTPAPYAIFANTASNLSGTLPVAQLSGTPAAAVNFTGALNGDVTGSQSVTVVSSVGGQTAANVASGASAANAGTSANTASTIVKRDAAGNFSAGVITANSFAGSGSGLTNLNASNLASGTLPDSRLSTNVATLSGSQTFTGSKSFNGGLSVNGPVIFSMSGPQNFEVSGTAIFDNSVYFGGVPSFNTFTVISSALVANLNADLLDGLHGASFSTNGHLHSAVDITSGTLADARLSANVDLLNSPQTFTAPKIFGSGATFQSGVVTFNAQPTFTGGALFQAGTVAFGIQPTFNGGAIFPSSGTAWFNGPPNFSSAPPLAPFTVASSIMVSGLNADMVDGLHTNSLAMASHTHSAADVTSGTLALARLPGAVLTNNATAVTLSGTFSGSFTGNGGNLTNIGSSSLASDAASLSKASGGNMAVASSSVGVGVTPTGSYKLQVNGKAYASDGVETGQGSSGTGMRFGTAAISATGKVASLAAGDLLWNSSTHTLSFTNNLSSEYIHYAGHKNEGSGGAFLSGYVSPFSSTTLATLDNNGEYIVVDISDRAWNTSDLGFVHAYCFYDNSRLVVQYFYHAE